MISISDNTATDYLLYFLGRTRVEAALRESGHAHPALNIPYLGTRELFWIKMAMSPDEVERYLALGPEPRRAALDGLAGKQPVDRLAEWIQPRYIDRVEWFASSTDLCRLAGALLERAATPSGAPLLDILAVNPALPKSAAWPYAGFKGGNEPGVMNGTCGALRPTVTRNQPRARRDRAGRAGRLSVYSQNHRCYARNTDALQSATRSPIVGSTMRTAPRMHRGRACTSCPPSRPSTCPLSLPLVAFSSCRSACPGGAARHT